MKVVAAILLLSGLAIMLFATVAYSELYTAATSAEPPSPDSLPLTQTIAPELFDRSQATTSPAALAKIAVNRIYAIGGLGLLLSSVGGFLLLLFRSPRPRMQS